MNILALIPAGIGALGLWRLGDLRRSDQAWGELLTRSRTRSPAAFHAGMVEDLPAPARRYFLYSIAPGTPLYRSALIRMSGEIGLGTKDKPGYLKMTAQQLLAPPLGFFWRVRAGKSAMWISGSDAMFGETSWTRFWLEDLIPVVRVSGRDHFRSSFGRMVAESVFWSPAALLPSEDVAWEPIDSTSAKVTLSRGDLHQAVVLTVGDDGRPLKVVMPRWSNANPAKKFQVQPFGGYLSDYKSFGGFTLPTRVEGGNFIDTADYFPFYKAKIEQVQML